MFATMMGLLSKGAIAGGSLWALWGAIQLGQGISDSAGPQMKSGVWQMVGGGVIVAAAAYFGSIPSI